MISESSSSQRRTRKRKEAGDYHTMEGSSSSWQVALAYGVDQSFGLYLCHLGAANLTYTILRSMLFVHPCRIDNIYESLHNFKHGFHNFKTQQSKPLEDRLILVYWGEKAVECGECASFVSEILASSWRNCGQDLAKSYNRCRFQLSEYSTLNADAIAIMTNLFRYMSMAYERIERETKDALKTEAHSPEFMDACREYFGENFHIVNDTKRMEAILKDLHETNINHLFARIFGRQHIQDTIERDKEALSRRATTKGNPGRPFPEDVDSQEEQQAVPVTTKGKNHAQNKKKAERKKKKRAAKADNSQFEVSEDAADSLKDVVDKGAGSIDIRDDTILNDDNSANIFRASSAVEEAHMVQSASPADEAVKSTVEDDVAPHASAKQSVKMGTLISTVISEATSFTSMVAANSAAAADSNRDISLEDVQDKKSSYKYEEHVGATLEPNDDDEGDWTEVVGNRKKNKKNKQIVHNSSGSYKLPANENPRFSRRESKPKGGEKIGNTLRVAPSLTHRAQPLSAFVKQQSSSKAAVSSANAGESKLTKSVLASTSSKRNFPKKEDSASIASKPTTTEGIHNNSVTAEQKLKTWQTPALVSTGIEQAITRPDWGPHLKSPTTEDHHSTTTGLAITKKQSSRSEAISVDAQVNIVASVPETAAESSAPIVASVPETAAESSAPIVASVPEAAAESSAPIVLEEYSDSGVSATLPNPEAVALVTTAASTGDDIHCNPTAPATPEDLKATALTVAENCVVENHFNIEIQARFSPSETIDPGPVPHYQHLKPFKKGRKMSENIVTTVAPTVIPHAAAISLVESLRDAGVEDGAMSSLVPLAAALTASSSNVPVPTTGPGHLRPFAGGRLDVSRANKVPKSAGSSPAPRRQEPEPVYYYPPPDVLTPENQEILDLIIKGPPYKKYPRVPKAADSREIQPLAADFVTKKLPIVTYDGKDAYEVLGDRCPAPLTVKDHPNVNKCIKEGELFHCAYCRVEISGNAEAENGIICPGCGPCSETRYCQRSHLLADSISHSEICGKNPGDYPLLWSELPLHYRSLYPYIKPLTGTMTAQCFRQMAHCLVINSDGVIENPFKAYFKVKMPMEDKVKTYNYVKQMYQFQDKGQYYLFYPDNLAGGVDIDMTIALPDGSDGCYREDQRFARVRNAAMLTQHPTLLCVIYRRIKDVLRHFAKGADQFHKLMQIFYSQFHEEFPSLNTATIAPLDKDYCFENDWRHVRNLVHDLELGNPILRAWITEDAEDDGIPADPTARYQGKYWDLVHGPTFRAGSTDRKDWGPGWHGGDELKWQKQLNRKYFKMITDELAKVETELEGEII